MSAPPPGGSPPQSPPYPQYSQPPQQAYPPPYPPQQPYYGTPTPPPKKSNTALIIVLVVVVIVVVLAALAWYAVTILMRPVTQAQITVTSVTFTINYPGSNHYFGSTTVSTCTSCPFTISFLNQFSQTITLTNQDTVAHNITSVLLSGTNFTIITSTPNPSTSSPVVVAAGATRSIVLSIQPTTPFTGSYTVTGVITTT